MTKSLRFIGRSAALLVGFCGAMAVAASAGAQEPAAPYQTLTGDQLDSLVAPVALYPDPLLAQTMLAATYPDQVDSAEKWVTVHGTQGIDSQPWDVSVRAVAHYPDALKLMDSNLDWTAWLGAAYANQPTETMNAVQHMRAAAQANGNLATTPQEQVVTEGSNIAIWPAQPDVMYVPVYDPDIYYDSCVTVFCTPYLGFGVGYPIGSWLMFDWNWPARRIYYTGWSGGGWIARSRPYVSLSGVYVNNSFRSVPFNHWARPAVGAFTHPGVSAFAAGRVAPVARGAAVGRPGPVARPWVSRIVPGVQARAATPWTSPRVTNPGQYRAIPGASSYRGAPTATPQYRAMPPQQTLPRALPRPAYAPPRQSAPAARQAPPQRQAPAPRAAAPVQRQAPAPRSAPAARSAPARGGGGHRG